MKTVLCYGDSLTWGYSPDGSGRHALKDRWPQVLQTELGNNVHVIADGLNGRTTAYDDHLSGFERNAAKTLTTALGTHFPLDLVIIMLGTNDMKHVLCGNALGAKRGNATVDRDRSHGTLPIRYRATRGVDHVAPTSWRVRGRRNSC